MTTKLSGIEAQLMGTKLLRLEAAKAELNKARSPSFRLLLWLGPWILAVVCGESFARYFGISTQLFLLLCTLVGGLCAALMQMTALQRRIDALSEIVGAQAQRDAGA